MFNRFDVCEAYAMYDMLWGPTSYGARLHRIGFRMSPLASLDNLSDDSKRIYGALVREHNRLYVGYTRYQKRNPKAPKWPGTYNMPRGSVSDWLRSIGALDAVHAMVRP